MAFQRRIPPTDGRYVAARTLDFGDWKVVEGEAFPWRERGMDEREVQRRWWIGELDAAPAVQPLPTIAERPVAPHVQYDTTTSVDVAKLTRRERRALRNQG